MPGVAREKPAENTRSHEDPTGMALPAFPRGKPRHQESWARALPDVDHGGGPSLGYPVASLLPVQRKIPHGAWRGQKGKKPGWREWPAGWRTAALSTQVLFLLRHGARSSAKTAGQRLRTADKLSRSWRLRGYKFAELGGAAPGKERSVRGPDITCTARGLRRPAE